MFELVGLLFPGIIGVTIINASKKLDVKGYLFYYSLLVMLSNSIMGLLFYLKTKVLFCDFTLLFFAKYCGLSVLINILLSLSINYIVNNFKFKIRRKK